MTGLSGGSTVTIEYQDAGPDSQGRRHFAARWSTPEMRRDALTCTGTCCVDREGKRRADAVHRAERGQHFNTEPGPHIAQWKSEGFVVSERQASDATTSNRRSR